MLKYKSVSIVGMAKNTGKTTCLNYILKRLATEQIKVAITSVGVDGEERDVLYDTQKPRIMLRSGNYFITTEKHFNERKLEAKVLDISSQMTPLGHLVTAKAESDGLVVISGPSDANLLRKYLDGMDAINVDITLVDGALSRMSLAAPTITDAMILCTGAACSIKLNQLVNKVKFLCDTINLKQHNEIITTYCNSLENGCWDIGYSSDNPQKYVATKFADSLFTSYTNISTLLDNQRISASSILTLFITGALTDSFLKEINATTEMLAVHLILRDFSRIFVSPQTYYKFIRRNGSINVLHKAKLIALCSNPTSPEGYNYQPEELRSVLEKELNLPVYDIVQEEKAS